MPEQWKNGGCRTALPAFLSYHTGSTKSTKILESVTMEKSEVLQSDLYKMKAGNPGRVRMLKKTVKKCLFCKHLLFSKMGAF